MGTCKTSTPKLHFHIEKFPSYQIKPDKTSPSSTPCITDFRNGFWMPGTTQSKPEVRSAWCIKATPTWDLKRLSPWKCADFKLQFQTNAERNVIFRTCAQNGTLEEVFRSYLRCSVVILTGCFSILIVISCIEW